MATMKDVAKLAGVSHGTVSNVLSGAKGVKIDKINRVEQAIKKLGYKTNALARNLKTNSAHKSIYVVMPNLGDGAFRDMYDGISRNAEQKGYNVNLHLTNELVYREKQVLSHAQMYNIDGAIVISCQPDNGEYFNRLAKTGLDIVFLSREVKGSDFVGLNFKNKFVKSIEAQIENGAKRIALITGPKEYSFEALCVEGYLKALFDSNVEINNQLIKVTNLNKESAMRAAIKLLNEEDRPDVIYVTSDIFTEGVRKAIELTILQGEPKPKLVIIKNPTWMSVNNDNEESFVLPYVKMGEMALNLLIERIEKTEKSEPKRILVSENVSNDSKKEIAVSYHGEKHKHIRVLLQEGQMGYAVKALSNDFRRRTGIDVTIDLVNYRNFLGMIKENKNSCKYDVFCFDIPWTKELVIGEHIENLEPYIKDRGLLFDQFDNNIFNEYCTYENQIYSLPHSYSVQMLYYRKDLFEKIKNKRLYHDMYKEELKVPKTWKEYNKVARFFTRQFNPDSETLYGTTLGGKVYSGTVCEFLPRLWAFGGSIFDGDHVTINNKHGIEALNNYVECYEYAPPGSQDWWWDEEAREFCSGSTAMMVLFTDHSTVLRDRNASEVVGKTGYGSIPGGISILGGWSIAMSTASKNKEEAFEFMKWTILEELAMPNAALGRILPYKSICENADLANLYPWHKDSFRVFENIGKRSSPDCSNATAVSEADYEQIIGESVHSAISKITTPKKALAMAAVRLEGLLDINQCR